MTSLLDLASQRILLAPHPDLRVAKLIVRRLIAAIEARDAVITQTRKASNTELLEETES